MCCKLRSLVLLCVLLVSGFGAKAFAEDFTIVLVGQTHAMLYPCNCPIEPDGGIARRATLIQQLRKTNPNVLVLDSGAFFAGGKMDQGSLGESLDKTRTMIHLKAMELMKYDALVLSQDEFNFGKEFLDNGISQTRIPFLSANIEGVKAAPYIIKKFGKTQVGVIGLIDPIIKGKISGVNILPAGEALKKAIGQLSGRKVDVIVLVSGLSEDDNRAMLKDNPEINVLIEGSKFSKEKVSSNVGPVLVLAPRWEGRRLVVVTFSMKDNVPEVKNIEDPRVSSKVADDKQALSLLPGCFSDGNCRKEGMIGTCVNPGTDKAVCQFKEAPKVALTVISKPDCRTCNSAAMVASLKKELPGLSVDTVIYPGERADKLIKELSLKFLPVYLLDKSIEKEAMFEKMKPSLEAKGGYYAINPQVAGFGYFLNRNKLPERVDVFLSLFNKDSGELLENLKEFTPEVHFLANEDGDGFASANGRLETEEYLRAVCVKKYYPGFFYNYIICRGRNPDSSWWDECLQDLDLSEVKTCATGSEGKKLLKDNISLNRELDIGGGPTYLLENQEIFGTVKVPSKEEFRKTLFKR
jgi:hypothetical protein